MLRPTRLARRAYHRRASHPRTFLNGSGTDFRRDPSPAPSSWTDAVDRARRHAAWSRRRTQRRQRHSWSQKAGLVGAALMMITVLLSFGPSTNPIDRAAEIAAVTEVQPPSSAPGPHDS